MTEQCILKKQQWLIVQPMCFKETNMAEQCYFKETTMTEQCILKKQQ